MRDRSSAGRDVALWRRSDGSELEMRGAYQEISPPERLVSTESWGGAWPETLNTLILMETDGKTTISQTVLYPSKEARDAATKTGMKDGVSESYDRLAEYLGTPMTTATANPRRSARDPPSRLGQVRVRRNAPAIPPAAQMLINPRRASRRAIS
jgi:Activator of Hsp90 ATPase homolog 1-like protein